MTTARATTPAELTSEVLRAYGATPEPRRRQILQSLVKHVHAFVTETSLTSEEWLAGVQFLTETGQMCDEVCGGYGLRARAAALGTGRGASSRW